MLRKAARFCDQKLGWNRIGFLLSFAIIAIAVMALVHILRHIKVDKVLEAMLAAKASDIVWASVFVAGGYFTLTFYDLFALRTIGWAKIPYRVAMLASFTSYSIGHNVGASVLTGGAVRYRIYSTWGLDAIAVTKLCFVAGLTFWLGNATVLGLGIAYVPNAASAIDQLPAWFNRGLAFAILTVLASYIVWVWRRPRVIGRQGWIVTLPGGPLTLLQIGIGILDLGCSAGGASVAYAASFPDAEVHAVDVGPAILRYAHARAEALGVAVHFHQMSVGALDFPDGSFDLVVSHNLMHEISRETMAALFAESRRVLRSGGLAVHQDVPIRGDRSLLERYMFAWETKYNNEPFWELFAEADVPRMLAQAGFAAGAIEETHLKRIDGPGSWYVALAQKSGEP